MGARGSRSHDEVTEYLATLPGDSRSVVAALREMLAARLPGMTEMVYHGALGYSPTGKPHDRVVYVLPATRHVTLGFFFGTQLPDPDHRLEGEGARMRNVKVRSVAEAADARIAALVEAAGADAAASLAALRAKRSTPRAEVTKRPRAARGAR